MCQFILCGKPHQTEHHSAGSGGAKCIFQTTFGYSRTSLCRSSLRIRLLGNALPGLGMEEELSELIEVKWQ